MRVKRRGRDRCGASAQERGVRVEGIEEGAVGVEDGEGMGV